MLKLQYKRLSGIVGLSMGLIFLTGCVSFTGLRSPRYNGQSIEQDDEAIQLYSDYAQVDEGNEHLYLRHPYSDSLREASMDFTDNEAAELNEGTYIVGEELPAGRAYLQGESSDFSPDRWIIHTANVVIRDEDEAVVFEQHFQDDNGVMQAFVDLREGHTVTLTGNDSILYVDYSDQSDLLSNQDGEESDSVSLISGHYEAGNQIEAGEYTIAEVISPRASELYVFTGDSDRNIIELHSRLNPYHIVSEEDNQQMLDFGEITPAMFEMNELNRERFEENKPTLILNEGDTLYLPMVNQLILEKN